MSKLPGTSVPTEGLLVYPYLPPLLISPTVRQALQSRPAGRAGQSAAFVEPVPALDHTESPSSLVARTRTWYSVPAASPVMMASGSVTSCGPSVKLPLVPWRYCRSYDCISGLPVLSGAV